MILVGGGTVPRMAARPSGMSERDTAIRGTRALGGAHGGAISRTSCCVAAEDVTYRVVAVEEDMMCTRRGSA